MNRLHELPPLSEAQLEIMNIVWDRGSCTVADVLEVLQSRRAITRNTAHTMLVRLEDKGWLTHQESAAGYLFKPTVDRKTAQIHTIKKVVDNVFDGSAESLVLALLGTCKIDSEEIGRIRKLIEDAKRRRKT